MGTATDKNGSHFYSSCSLWSIENIVGVYALHAGFILIAVVVYTLLCSARGLFIFYQMILIAK